MAVIFEILAVYYMVKESEYRRAKLGDVKERMVTNSTGDIGIYNSSLYILAI